MQDTLSNIRKPIAFFISAANIWKVKYFLKHFRKYQKKNKNKTLLHSGKNRQQIRRAYRDSSIALFLGLKYGFMVYILLLNFKRCYILDIIIVEYNLFQKTILYYH